MLHSLLSLKLLSLRKILSFELSEWRHMSVFQFVFFLFPFDFLRILFNTSLIRFGHVKQRLIIVNVILGFYCGRNDLFMDIVFDFINDGFESKFWLIFYLTLNCVTMVTFRLNKKIISFLNDLQNWLPYISKWSF